MGGAGMELTGSRDKTSAPFREVLRGIEAQA